MLTLWQFQQISKEGSFVSEQWLHAQSSPLILSCEDSKITIARLKSASSRTQSSGQESIAETSPIAP